MTAIAASIPIRDSTKPAKATRKPTPERFSVEDRALPTLSLIITKATPATSGRMTSHHASRAAEKVYGRLMHTKPATEVTKLSGPNDSDIRVFFRLFIAASVPPVQPAARLQVDRSRHPELGHCV